VLKDLLLKDNGAKKDGSLLADDQCRGTDKDEDDVIIGA
jgi:hypothetical protein